LSGNDIISPDWKLINLLFFACIFLCAQRKHTCSNKDQMLLVARSLNEETLRDPAKAGVEAREPIILPAAGQMQTAEVATQEVLQVRIFENQDRKIQEQIVLPMKKSISEDLSKNHLIPFKSNPL
jgi:hypothetical protein